MLLRRVHDCTAFPTTAAALALAALARVQRGQRARRVRRIRAHSSERKQRPLRVRVRHPSLVPLLSRLHGLRLPAGIPAAASISPASPGVAFAAGIAPSSALLAASASPAAAAAGPDREHDR